MPIFRAEISAHMGESDDGNVGCTYRGVVELLNRVPFLIDGTLLGPLLVMVLPVSQPVSAAFPFSITLSSSVSIDGLGAVPRLLLDSEADWGGVG